MSWSLAKLNALAENRPLFDESMTIGLEAGDLVMVFLLFGLSWRRESPC